tara:strand:- start:2681 stop:2926 length:246 start_codon:yes stop_codon:yes gene_type:complete
MAKKKRMRKKLLELLSDGPKDTEYLFAWFNNNTSHGTTMQELGNVLAKNSQIEQSGYRDFRWAGGDVRGGDRVAVWKLKDD